MAEGKLQSQGETTRAITIGELSRQILRLLENGIGAVNVVGEVSGVKIPASGHCYFTLKDDDAAVNAVCFRSTLQRGSFCPADGMQIEVRGRVTAYTRRSEYQIIIDSMREAGEGALMRRFLELKEKLKAEGLFDGALKQPIPRLPRRIGLVTSATGAALRDMLNVLGRRAGGLQIFLSPAAVQGDAAPLEIVAAIERLQRHGQVDVIIAGRGGGSIEDLWAFNDERVVRAIAACPIPIISAVGHETDTTLADYAADLRAPTPSAAAELVTAHYGDLIDRIHQYARRLQRAMQYQLAERRNRLARCQTSWGLRSPRERMERAMQRLDDLRDAMTAAQARCLRQRQEWLMVLSARHRQASPLRQLRVYRERLSRAWALLHAVGPARWSGQLREQRRTLIQTQRQLQTDVSWQLHRFRLRWGALNDRLGTVNPEAILNRGYSIVTHGKRNRLVMRPEQVKPEEIVRIQSAGGVWRAAALPPGEDLFEGLEKE